MVILQNKFNMENREYIYGDANYLRRNYPIADYIDRYDKMLFGIKTDTLQLLYTDIRFFENLETEDEESDTMQFENLENFRNHNFAQNNVFLQSFVDKLWSILNIRRPIIVHPSRVSPAENGTECELH